MLIAETERLLLRVWKDSDLSDGMTLWTDPEVTRYIAPEPFNQAQVKEHLKRLSQCQEDYGFQYWALELKQESRIIGCCGLRPWIFGERKNCIELGFHIAREFWRQGFALEASRKVIEYAFRDLGLQQLYSGYHPENNASKALLLKLGFKKYKDILFPQTGKLHPSYFLQGPLV